MNAVSQYVTATRPTWNELVLENMDFVQTLAHALKTRLPPGIDVGELVQAGMIGLIEAAKAYDATSAASFQTFARYRVRGAMLDELRHQDWTPRSVARKSREVAAVARDVMSEKGELDDAEVIKRLGIDKDEYHRILADSVGTKILSFEEDDEAFAVEDDNTVRPDSIVETEDLIDHLAEAIQTLQPREQLVLSLVYTEELNFREAGDVLRVTLSRVSQIHSRALLQLRTYLMRTKKRG